MEENNHKIDTSKVPLTVIPIAISKGIVYVTTMKIGNSNIIIGLGRGTPVIDGQMSQDAIVGVLKEIMVESPADFLIFPSKLTAMGDHKISSNSVLLIEKLSQEIRGEMSTSKHRKLKEENER